MSAEATSFPEPAVDSVAAAVATAPASTPFTSSSSSASSTSTSTSSSTSTASSTPLSLPYPPASPTKPAIRPNPHPYAIKTTSTAVLSRASSVGHAASPRHHYVPRTTNSSASAAAAAGQRSPEKKAARSEYRAHRFSTPLSGGDRPPSFPQLPLLQLQLPLSARAGSGDEARVSRSRSRSQSHSEDSAGSASSEPPSPLPEAQSSPDTPLLYEPATTKKSSTPAIAPLRRSGTLPTFPSSAGKKTTMGETTTPGGVGFEDLPTNPKTWTPAQLSGYLVTALRVRAADSPAGTVAVAAPVARDIAGWIRAQCITGRTFLRWGEDDLELLGINTLWRTALLDAARNLRQNVLRGRIWGSPPLPTVGDDADADAVHSQMPAFIVTAASSASSASGRDSSASESSTGESADGPSSGLGSVTANGGSRARRRNAGQRVRGLVSRWESHSRSGSEAGSESELEPSPLLPPTPSSATLMPAPVIRNGASAAGRMMMMNDEEPSIEALLAALPPDEDLDGAEFGTLGGGGTTRARVGSGGGGAGAWGARAWEELDIGTTVKRVEEHVETLVRRRGASTGAGDSPGIGGGGGRGSVRSVRAPAGTVGRAGSRRLVSALFLGAQQQQSPEADEQGVIVVSGDEEAAGKTSRKRKTVSSVFGEEDGEAQQRTRAAQQIKEAEEEEQEQEQERRVEALERAAEAELRGTRAVLDALRARLEAVESKVREMEAREDAHYEAVVRAYVRDDDGPDAGEGEGGGLGGPVPLDVSRTPPPPPQDDEAEPVNPVVAQTADEIPAAAARDTTPPSPLALKTEKKTSTMLSSLFDPDDDSDYDGASTVAAGAPTVGEYDTAPGALVEPSALSEIPGYVMLVSLGVCSVVLRVVLRRIVAGRRT